MPLAATPTRIRCRPRLCTGVSVAAERLASEPAKRIRGSVPQPALAARVTGALCVLLICASSWGAAEPPKNPGDEILQYLDRNIAWYRQVTAVVQSPVDPE